MDIQATDLSKTFGDSNFALDTLNLNIQSKSCLALIGPSGGGKSTLLRIIAGLIKPTSGSISINGAPIVFEENNLIQHRRNLGIVFQAFNLFPHYTALENIALPLRIVHGISDSDANERAMAELKRFHLEPHAHKRPNQLSGGQNQRVAIARALAIKPNLILLDEPTSALDPEMAAEVLDAIMELRQDNIDLIIVTHQMGFARQAADHVAMISVGKVTEDSPPEQLFENPQTAELQRFLSRILKY